MLGASMDLPPISYVFLALAGFFFIPVAALLCFELAVAILARAQPCPNNVTVSPAEKTVREELEVDATVKRRKQNSRTP